MVSKGNSLHYNGTKLNVTMKVRATYNHGGIKNKTITTIQDQT